jgi:hypothetical protein
MHNWLEGVLQHHVRVLWGIGIVLSVPNETEDDDEILPSPVSSEYMVTLNEELSALEAESRQFKDTPSHLKCLRSEASFLQQNSLDEVEGSDSDGDVDFQPDDESDTDNEDSEEAWRATCVFSTVKLADIHACLSETIIPSWIERPPMNLKSHGKLKADQWFLLFSIFLPVVLLEIWSHSSSRRHELLLDNFYNLVTCTNILCAYSVTPTSADAYLEHFIEYRKSSKILFPNIRPRPNHHFAMHNPDLMKFWGPLIRLSKFPYERQNGNLQKIKTNGHICELYFII